MSAPDPQTATAAVLRTQEPSHARNRWRLTHGQAELFGKLLLLGGLVGGGLEGFWFILGSKPSVRDDASLWTLVRREVSRSSHPVVLTGTSRTHYGLDPSVLAREIPGYDWFDLALDGSSPVPVLEDLARDTAFRGSVICEITPFYLFTGDLPYSDSIKFVRDYHNHKASWGDSIETGLRVAVQSRFRFARDDANFQNLSKRVWPGGSFPYGESSMLPNRLLQLDASHADLQLTSDRWARITLRNKLAFHETDANFSRIADSVRAIESRGGKVVFLRMIVTGKVREMEDRLYPRAQYWDRFARSQSSLSIHFSDFPSLMKFNCPEGSHLDYRQAAAFSSEFARLLKAFLVF